MFKKRLLNTVAIPVLSVAVLAKPVAASVTGHPERQVQTQQAEEKLIQLAQAVTCNDGSEAPDAETCAARDAQAAAEEEQRRLAEEEAQRQAEAQAQAEAEAQAQAEAEAQAQAEAEAQRAAEEEAQRQAEAEAQRAAEEEAQRQAEAEAQRAAEEEAQRQAEAEAQAQAEAEAQAQAEAEAQAQAEAEAEAQRAAEEAQQAAVTCADGSQAASEDECPVPATPEEQPVEEPQPQTEEQPTEEQPVEEQATEEQPTEEQATEEPAAPEQTEEQAPATDETQETEQPAEEQPAQTVTCADGSQAASEAECAVAPPAEQPSEEQQQTGEQPTEQPATDEQATGEEVPADGQQPEGEQVLVPAVEPPVDQPVEEITDTRTVEENEAIAEDPSQTSETVLLPVEDGAAVLDSDKEADNAGGETAREQRTQLRAQEDVAPPPETDAVAQADAVQVDPQTIQATIAEQGTTLDAAPTFAVPTSVTNVTNSSVTNNITNNITNNTIIQNNVVNQITEIRVIEQIDNRTVINVGNQIVVRSDDRDRLRYDAEETYYEQLSRGRVRETIERADGSKLVTVYNRYGDIIIRSRISPRGREYVLMYSPEADRERPTIFVDVGLSLPPMRLTIPVSDYIVSTTRSPDRDYYDFLAQPPVERVERVYSIDEVKSSARIRDKVRRIDLDTITFPSGSAEVPLEQARTLRRVAQAMEKLLEKDPGEVFLIEGHTDAVGSDRSNLILSDKRAETVANLLTEVYGIPPENMSVQGYGERFLKIRTEAAEQQNRRVAIRRVTTLVRPAGVSSND